MREKRSKQPINKLGDTATKSFGMNCLYALSKVGSGLGGLAQLAINL
jgi:hypothetical protein